MDRFDPLAKKAKVSGGAGAGAGAGGGRGRGRGRKMFIPPREAPVFYPSADEFQDCLGYVQKIKPIAEQYGICKIVPPRDWQPPFVLDINQLKVQPRIQKLNELDAKTRIKLNFISLLMKFWQLQGRQIRAPSLRDDKLLDVYSLRQLVQRNGGYEQCTRTGCWSLFAKEMKIEQKNGANLLQLYYESFIYPYDVYVRENPDLDFSAEKLSDSKKTYRNNNIKMTDGERNETVADTKRIKQNDEDGSANEPMIPLFNIKDVDLKDEIKDIKENKELKKLQFFGAGPKMAGLPDLISIANKRESKSPKQINKSNIYNCLACDKDDDEKLLLICSKCYTYFHTYCLKPALREVPKHEWHCPFCLASKIRKFHVPYGFETSTREYSLREFGEMADQFKCRYFRREAHEVSNAACEQEFWKIVQDLDETVTVEYGADLHSMEHGSGFPTVPDGGPHDVYVHSSWNLNNLPVAEESVLGHIGGSISGMKIPWMYVGMCFSSFCWHNEDHWSYSINYLHWGEAKTWYGIPGQMAEQFEAIMKDEAAELFESQPDLLHQLVTIMNPNIFIDRGVQVSRLDQQAGEFVITFPRAYHCGFNQGYNFAEAVNFAPADWIKIGRECISHYAQLKRFCVFSHDELVCRMSFLPSNTLSFSISEALLQDLISMTDREKRKRKELLDNGIKSAKKVQFEAIPDNERMCHECKTTCFLSAIKCNKCNNDKLYCINHWNKICKCPPSNYSMQYRYTVDDLLRMVISINKRQLQQRRWLTNVKLALNPQDGKSKVPFAQIKKLLGEAKAWKSPKPEFVYALTRVHSTVENCIDIIKQMQNSCKNGSSSDNDSDEIVILEDKLNYDELLKLIEEINGLPCEFDEFADLLAMTEKVTEFRRREIEMCKKSFAEIDPKEIESLYTQSLTLCIQCPDFENFYIQFKKSQKNKSRTKK